MELDPHTIIPSFVRDRMDLEDNPQFPLFVESIRTEGTKASDPGWCRPRTRPTLTRSHTVTVACAPAEFVGIPVRAIVMPLTDEQLVIAQGIENTERANLSFIEQALLRSS